MPLCVPASRLLHIILLQEVSHRALTVAFARVVLLYSSALLAHHRVLAAEAEAKAAAEAAQALALAAAQPQSTQVSPAKKKAAAPTGGHASKVDCLACCAVTHTHGACPALTGYQ